MRLLEILLAIVLLPWWPGAKRQGRIWRLLPVFIGGLLVLHLLVDQPRWQMIPIYAASVMDSSQTNSPIGANNKKCLLLLRAALNLGTIACLAVGVISCMLLPVCQLPDPTGRYKVGTQYGELAQSRIDPT